MTTTAMPTGVDTNVDAALATLTVAFAGDPIMRWFYPDAPRYVTHFPEVAQLLGAAAFDTGNVDRSPAFEGTALWVPPGSPLDDEAAGELLVRSIDEARHEAVFGFFEEVVEYHPEEPHWYLPLIGVDPQHQGKGIGSALLRERLARVDDDGLGAYLEASTARNRGLYERHGFVTLTEIQVGDSPPLWPMWRQPNPQ